MCWPADGTRSARAVTGGPRGHPAGTSHATNGSCRRACPVSRASASSVSPRSNLRTTSSLRRAFQRRGSQPPSERPSSAPQRDPAASSSLAHYARHHRPPEVQSSVRSEPGPAPTWTTTSVYRFAHANSRARATASRQRSSRARMRSYPAGRASERPARRPVAAAK